MNRSEKAIHGCIIGTAVGDAIGLPFEGISRKRIARLTTVPLNHCFFFGRGMISDDTEHTCMVGQAILASKGEPEVFVKQLAKRLRWWLLGLPAGIGFTTLRSILKLWLGISPNKSGVWSAGNGPAMRSAIIGVYASDNNERLTELVKKSTQLTHSDPKALKGAMIVAKLAAYNATANEVNREECIETLLQLSEDDEILRELIEKAITSAKHNETASEFCQTLNLRNGVTGYIYHTLPVVLQIWLRHPRDYESAITEAVLCGGDTDTVAAIIGGMVGAGCGVEGIPNNWVNGISEWPRSIHWMKKLADELANSTVDNKSAKPVLLNIPGVMLRNLFFMVWVLAHGFRRLLPPY